MVTTKNYPLHRLTNIARILGLLTLLGFSRALADTESRSGTAKVYTGTVAQVISAVTNSFSSGRYHDMFLFQLPLEYDTAHDRWSNRPATNEWILDPGHLPLSVIPVGKKTAPYYARFIIKVSPAVTNSCKVTVTTILASIPNGKEIGIHGGWAVHMKDIRPVREEETNVLLRVESQLHSIQNGDTKPLPPTPDTKDAAEYPIKQVMELNHEANTKSRSADYNE